MSDKNYEGSCILYRLEKTGVQGSVTIDGIKWYATVIATGVEKPSHQLFLKNANNIDYTGAVLFKNDPDKKSMLSGSIQMHKSYWVDVFDNPSKQPGGDNYFTLRFNEKQAKTQESLYPNQQPTSSLQGAL